MTRGWLVHRARRELRRHRGAAALLAIGFCTSAMLLGAWRLAAAGGESAAPALRRGIHVIAYLRDDVGSSRAGVLRETLARLPGVHEARLVSSQEAADRLRDRLGGEAGLLDGIEEGFLPASIEVGLRPTADVGTRAHSLGARLRSIDGVAEVDDMGAAPARIASWLTLAAAAGRIALVLAALAALAAVALAVRAGRADRSAEAEVMAFLGETPLGARMPAALAGGASAVAGAVVAWLMLYVAFLIVRGNAAAALAALDGGPPRFFSVSDLAIGLGAALGLGWLSGFISARPPRTSDA